MELSKHNILSKVHQHDEYFIVNLLSGNADLISSQEARRILNGEVLNDEEYISKGYVIDPAEEKRLFRKKYLDFIDSRETDEIQLFYAPTYTCNFNCSYCYQEGYAHEIAGDAIKTAGAFFSYINREFAGRKKYVTLFGGEPLLNNQSAREFLQYFLQQCVQLNLEVAVVTNGYNLAAYIPLLAQASVREVQVTLDGSENIHNRRRPLKNGGGTFEHIVMGIDAALEAGIPVNLRIVLDKENIGDLPALARFAVQKGWTQSSLFKTQLGRNYELHYCQSSQSKLYSRIDLYKDLYNLIQQHPEILGFHKPSYSVAKFLFENEELPDPLFDSCPGCKTEWAFDYSGRIFSCTATVGKPGEELGTFYPEITLNRSKITQWQQRDVLSIEACSNCNLRLACGGGCASVAFNRDHQINSPDCRPVKDLLELGMALYFNPQLKTYHERNSNG